MGAENIHVQTPGLAADVSAFVNNNFLMNYLRDDLKDLT